MLRFSDGEEFDTSIKIMKIIKRKDGYYVIGQNVLIPVDGVKEGIAVLKAFKQPIAIELR